MKKRYNDFFQLDSSLKAKYSALIDVPFPKKAMIPTKKLVLDRIIQLDEYMKALARINPVPREVINFLGLAVVDSTLQASKASTTPPSTLPSVLETNHAPQMLKGASGLISAVAVDKLAGSTRQQVSY